MKVKQLKTRILETPADNPLVVGLPEPTGTRQFVSVEVMTDDGIEGAGITFFGGALTGALRQAVDSLGDLTIGEDPLRVEAIAAKLRRAASGSGPGGIFTLALSAIDIALWDIKGKALNLPVSSLIGGYRERVPTYASGALLRQHPLNYLEQAGSRLTGMGFTQMKTQLGTEPTVSAAVERIRVLREAVGDDIDLMCDINQLWKVHQAIEIGKRIEPYHLFWLEDVVPHDDYQGMARVTDALTTPIAAGEYVYGIGSFRQLLENRSMDIVMIDVVRAGGITQWLKIAGMAEAFDLPVVSHLLPEIQVHLICGIPNGLTVEYMPWTQAFWEEMPRIENGEMIVSEKPGLGLAFDKAAIERFQIA